MGSLNGTALALLRKFESRSATVAVVGLGYVGLPLALEFVRSGLQVTGVDVDSGRLRAVAEGRSYIDDITDAELGAAVRSGRLRAAAPDEGLRDADAISICVPTPLRKSRDPDISYIVAATEALARHMSPGRLVVLESTTYPGTTEEVILPKLEATGLAVGKDFFLAFSPERVDPGNRVWKTRNTPKVVGGTTPACTELAVALYRSAVDRIVPVSSTKVAEMVKLLENTFRSVNIGLVNELAIMCDKLRCPVWEVIEAAATKPFGFMPFYPGPGLGGHCIPIDPHYLSWKLRMLNYNARFIELAGEVNSHMPDWLVQKIADALNDRSRSVRGSSVFVLGAAYKRDVADVRESPALDVIQLLLEKGAAVTYHDPHAPEIHLHAGGTMKSVAFGAETLRRADCVVIVTDHSSYDPAFITEHARLVVDSRNLTKGLDGGGKIVRL